MATDHDVAFPVLKPIDLAALSARGRRRQVHTGEVLFTEGDRNLSFFVVLSGGVEILEHSRGTPHSVTIHHPGQFTGDVDVLSGRAVLVTGRVIQDGEVVQLSSADLRRAVDELPELGETIVKAFLMRRTLLLGEGFMGARIIGSRFSPDTHRLRDFAARNGVPVKWIDLDADAEADALLRQF